MTGLSCDVTLARDTEADSYFENKKYELNVSLPHQALALAQALARSRWTRCLIAVLTDAEYFFEGLGEHGPAGCLLCEGAVA